MTWDYFKELTVQDLLELISQRTDLVRTLKNGIKPIKLKTNTLKKTSLKEEFSNL